MLSGCLLLLVVTLSRSRVLREEPRYVPRENDDATITDARIVGLHGAGKGEPSARNQAVASVSASGDVTTNMASVATVAGRSGDDINRPGGAPVPAEWSNWEQCSTTCGSGERIRNCISGDCKGPTTKSCTNNPPCPSDGEWGDWTACGVTCGQGTQSRECARMPKHGGKDCEGPKLQDCVEAPCQVDAVWGDWTECGVTCGKGMRSRECVQLPEHGGKPCEGPQVEECEQPICKECDTNAHCTDVNKSLCDRINQCVPCIEDINCIHIAEDMECTAGRCKSKEKEEVAEKVEQFKIEWFHIAGGAGVLILLAGIGIFCAYRSGRSTGVVTGRQAAAESSDSDEDPAIRGRGGKKI
eukprot:GEMP01015564.1.p1 GENE.GEMP01015564.1~~GEMP01015564.1.p1  ORF type:complete len:356 (+),score=81.14 GEMP01015564.1:138-1205(+)